MSPSAKRTYGILLVCKVWHTARTSFQRDKSPVACEPAKHGPKGHMPDDALLGELAAGTTLRHDHGGQFNSHAFRAELKTLGIASRPSFVRQPEGNGCVEAFIRTLKEQLLLLNFHRTVEELNQALRDFAKRFNNHWIMGRIGYRTPAAHRRFPREEAA